MYRIGIDIGGTFTDLALADSTGRIVIAKAPSTTRDPSEGVLEGLSRLAAELNTERDELLANTDRIVHGTTVATNALLERKGARVVFLTTDGHRDVIEMREGLKDDRYNLRMAPPVPLVPRTHRLAVRERTRYDGQVEVALDRDSLSSAVAEARRLGAEAVAIGYLHSYMNDAHEVASGRLVAEEMPDAYVSLSSEVLPQIKEHERFWTTVANAYVGPIVSSYLGRLQDRLAEAGFAGELLIMHSHGGVAPLDESSRLAAGLVLSGPAGGVAAASVASRLLDQGDLITLDVGGTSTDVALLENGSARLTGHKRVGVATVSLPSLDIQTLGAGGGSIARVAGAILHVGPESVGADPGPACYARGGSQASVTDANVVLGFLDPNSFLGGRITLDVAAAESAVQRIADKLGGGLLEAADGIYRIANTKMAEGIRLTSVRRGVDPRRFTLVAFGGAAGLHVVEVARQLEMRRVVVPDVAAVLSAWGMLATDLRYETVRSRLVETSRLSGGELADLFRDMEADARSRLSGFAGVIDSFAALDMRYGEQVYEVTVPIDRLDITEAGAVQRIVDRFHARHEELYAYSAPGQEVVIVNLRMAVVGRLPDLELMSSRYDSAPMVPSGSRKVFLDGWAEVPVYRFDRLSPDLTLAGPAIFESATTTVLIGEHDVVTVTEHGWLDIQLRAS